MIRTFVCGGLLGEKVDRFELDAADGWTPRRLLEQFRGRLPRSARIQVAIDGKILVGDPVMDDEIRDGQQVVVLPETAGEGLLGTIIYAVIYALAAAAVNYLISLLSPRQRAGGLAQERGDDTSQTYAWDGIKTNYGPGLPIPWGYGYHGLGGQVVWTDSQASRQSPQYSIDDRLRLIVSLCEGPIHSIGERGGEIDFMGGFVGAPLGPPLPVGILINGNVLAGIPTTSPSAAAWIRPGTHDQSPLPAPFTGISEVTTLNEELRLSQGVIFTYPDDFEVQQVSFVISMPAGAYIQQPNGQLTSLVGVNVQFQFRFAGLSWSVAVGGAVAAGGPFVGAYAQTFHVQLPIAPGGGATQTKGPFEVLVTRTGTPPGTNESSQMLLRDVIVRRPHTLRYPQEAIIALELQAGARFSGGLPQLVIPTKMALVRVWDATNGWSPRCWDVPAAPFNFNTYAPGRNPAWCLLDYLLARWGLGSYLTEDDIDLPAFRRWAAFCDTDPNPADPWGEPAFTVDIVGDRPRPAWEWVLAFCAAGRAAPVWRNGKLSVVYQYRDEHGDAGITVPAKAVTQLITSGNCEDVSPKWTSKSQLPTVYLFQFLNEDKNWTQDPLPVEDDEGSLNDPSVLGKDQYKPETIQAWGVTRPQQIFREGRWRHRINRMVRRELTFKTGPWALGAETGDLIDFAHEVMRPFGTDVPTTMQVLVGTDVVVDAITVDHKIGSVVGSAIAARGPDGAPVHIAVLSKTPTTVDGKDATQLFLDGVPDIAKGATVVFGLADKLVETYQIVAITLQKDLKREVHCIQWTPDAYDPITLEDYEGTSPPATLLAPQSGDEPPPPVLGLSVQFEPDGGQQVSWAPPANKVGTEARVYFRDTGREDASWQLAGVTTERTMRIRGLLVGHAYEVSVCLQNNRGDTVLPDLGDRLEFIPQEFPPWQPPSVTGVRATLMEDYLLVEADELGQGDLAYFELSMGTSWAARRVLMRERMPRFYLPEPAAGPQLMVAARSTTGLYGNPVAIGNPNWMPVCSIAELDEDDFATAPAGTHTGTEWNATDEVIELQDGVFVGTYESDELDAGYQGPFHWQVRYDAGEVDLGTIGEDLGLVGDGDARWSTIEGRPASATQPGIDWRDLIGDDEGPIGDIPADELVGGHIGEVGSHTRVLIESRHYVDGAWSGYREHTDRVVVASRMQVRATLSRRAETYRTTIKQLRYVALI